MRKFKVLSISLILDGKPKNFKLWFTFSDELDKITLMGKQSREKLARRNSNDENRNSGGFQFGLEKTCLFIITWGTYLVLFTPLIVNTKFFFPFVAPKTIFFRMVIEIILAAYLFLVIAHKVYRPRINILTITITLFLGVFILASFTGINLERSFWSTNERMTGILTMLHLFAFFIVLSSVFKNKKDWEKILGVSILVGVILSLYILMSNKLSTRGGGTIGNTSFMAAYLLFDVFFALILFLSNFLKKGNWSLFWQFFSGVGLLIMLPVFLNSTGRGAIIAFFGGLFLLGLGYLLFSQKKILKRLAWAIVLVLVILSIASAVFQPSFVKNKIAATFIEMKSRIVVWESGWKGFLEKPVLGWGPENFIVVFSKYFNPCIFLPACGGEIWFDRTHNIILDTLVTTGVVGLLSYLAILIAAIGGLLRVASKVVEGKNIFIPLGLAVLLLAYFFQNLLVFDMINTYLVFFLSLSFICFLTQRPTGEKEAVAGRVNPVLASIIIMATVFVFWTTNVVPLRANAYVIKMVNSQDVNEASLFFQKSLNTWMDKYEPREQFTQKMYRAGYQPIPGENKESFQKAFDLVEAEMKKGVEQNYLDFRPHLFLGELYVSAYHFSGREEYLVRAEQTLQKAIQLSPTNQQGYWNLAEVKIAQGKIAETVSLLQKAVALEPKLGSSHWYLSTAYKIAGEYKLALKEVYAARDNGYEWKNNEEDIKKVIEIYQLAGEDPHLINNDQDLIELCLAILKADPKKFDVWASLAASYANMGQFEKARETATKLMEINPASAPQVKEFLKTLPQ